jgi:FtsP/CotA-like multicopper oxidase with cupredoxin domain
MNTQTYRYASFLLFIGLLGLPWPSCAQAERTVLPPAVPDRLKVPDGQAVLLEALGKGVQIYRCQGTTADSEKFEWAFVAPEAMLLNSKGGTIGKHYAGPTWEATDGSKVTGELQNRADAPDPSAIPWLLLKAKSNEGSGAFKTVTYIQRVNTEGGKAPAEGCDQSRMNASIRVHYVADYYFYTAAR